MERPAREMMEAEAVVEQVGALVRAKWAVEAAAEALVEALKRQAKGQVRLLSLLILLDPRGRVRFGRHSGGLPRNPSTRRIAFERTA